MVLLLVCYARCTSVLDLANLREFVLLPYHTIAYLLIGFAHVQVEPQLYSCFTYIPHKILMLLPQYNSLLYNPQDSAVSDITLLTKCTVKCTIMSKREGGKYFFNKHKVTTWYVCNLSNVVTSTILKHKKIKKKHSLIIAFFICFGKTHLMAIGRSCCIRTWESYDVRP